MECDGTPQVHGLYKGQQKGNKNSIANQQNTV